MKLLRIIYGLLAVVIITSCEKDGVAEVTKTDNIDEVTKTDFSISGFAQKGQFIKGTAITAYSLNDKLVATGASFPAIITDDLGSFNLSGEVSAPYMELKADGYYFNENKGATSESPIYLSALVKTSQNAANINLLTTITGGRIRSLIESGLSFDAAKKQAEKEILETLSIPASDISVGFEEMNISKDTYADAILFATSCIIQQDRNTGEIQKLISDISSDFAATGAISKSLQDKLEKSRRSVSVSKILSNMMSFYNDLGVSDYRIPPFYAIIDNEYAQGFYIVSQSISSYRDIPSEGESVSFSAVSYEDFVIESDVDWISSTITETSSKFYSIDISISNNPDYSKRTAEVYVKSTSGETLYSRSITQEGSGQCILLDIKNSGGSRSLDDGDIVNVNGIDYPVSFHSQSGKYCVYVPYSDSGYGISNKPEMIVAGTNGDVLCATFSYGAEINNYIFKSEQGIITFSNDSRGVSNIFISRINSVPCYAALKSYQDIPLANPALVTLEPACALLSLEFTDEYGNPIQSISKLEIETDIDGFLSGEVTSCMYPTQNLYDPSYVVPTDMFKNKSNKVTIHNTDKENKISLLIHPQSLSMIKCTAYNENNDQLFQFSQDVSLELIKGQNIKLQIAVNK